MKVQTFCEILGSDFYAGVPDSQLKALCNFLMDTYGVDGDHHVIAANEGNCVALAAGYHLATGKVPVVYMQNSGEGNIINPVASLLNQEVYAIPMIFVVGWRGEPGVHDEPQHIYQGKITLRLLEDMEIDCFVVDKNTTEVDLTQTMKAFETALAAGRQVAFVIRANALSFDKRIDYRNEYTMRRETVIERITAISENDPIISTTGKTSRELFEIRERTGHGQKCDFLTVGSMGHSSSIALGIALQKPDTTLWCIDGDGALLMHMGAMAVVGNRKPRNLIHVVINNGAHESVGGMPTVAETLDLPAIAAACGYPYAASVSDEAALERELLAAKKRGQLSFIEVKCAIGSRDDLGRPISTPIENKRRVMEHLVQE